MAQDYFDAVRPKQTQNSPLDEISPPDQMQQNHYNRQLDIAQNPSLILQHVKDGTLQPPDLLTLGTLYPQLHNAMVKKAGAALIEAKAKEMELPYKQKQALSMLLGQPLDSTMTPMAMQTIMQANAPQQDQQQPQGKKSKSGATSSELKQLNKVDDLYKTPIEDRATDQKE